MSYGEQKNEVELQGNLKAAYFPKELGLASSTREVVPNISVVNGSKHNIQERTHLRTTRDGKARKTPFVSKGLIIWPVLALIMSGISLFVEQSVVTIRWDESSAWFSGRIDVGPNADGTSGQLEEDISLFTFWAFGAYECEKEYVEQSAYYGAETYFDCSDFDAIPGNDPLGDLFDQCEAEANLLVDIDVQCFFAAEVPFSYDYTHVYITHDCYDAHILTQLVSSLCVTFGLVLTAIGLFTANRANQKQANPRAAALAHFLLLGGGFLQFLGPILYLDRKKNVLFPFFPDEAGYDCDEAFGYAGVGVYFACVFGGVQMLMTFIFMVHHSGDVVPSGHKASLYATVLFWSIVLVSIRFMTWDPAYINGECEFFSWSYSTYGGKNYNDNDYYYSGDNDSCSDPFDTSNSYLSVGSILFLAIYPFWMCHCASFINSVMNSFSKHASSRAEPELLRLLPLLKTQPTKLTVQVDCYHEEKLQVSVDAYGNRKYVEDNKQTVTFTGRREIKLDNVEDISLHWFELGDVSNIDLDLELNWQVKDDDTKEEIARQVKAFEDECRGKDILLRSQILLTVGPVTVDIINPDPKRPPYSPRLEVIYNTVLKSGNHAGCPMLRSRAAGWAFGLCGLLDLWKYLVSDGLQKKTYRVLKVVKCNETPELKAERAEKKASRDAARNAFQSSRRQQLLHANNDAPPLVNLDMKNVDPAVLAQALLLVQQQQQQNPPAMPYQGQPQPFQQHPYQGQQQPYQQQPYQQQPYQQQPYQQQPPYQGQPMAAPPPFQEPPPIDAPPFQETNSITSADISLDVK